MKMWRDYLAKKIEALKTAIEFLENEQKAND